MQSADLIAAAFGVFNSLRLVSYFPQIVAVARDQTGAAAISLSCWSIWIGANATTALYAYINVGDIVLAVMSAFNAVCCLTVVALALLKRAARWRRVPPSLSPDCQAIDVATRSASPTTCMVCPQQRRAHIADRRQPRNAPPAAACAGPPFNVIESEPR
jgi:hypothetical protein